MEIPCVYKFTRQPRNVDMLNKLLDIPNNRSVRKEQEMDLKRKATVEGKITLRALKCCKVKSFRSFVFIYSCILFTEHCNLPDVMLTTNTFA